MSVAPPYHAPPRGVPFLDSIAEPPRRLRIAVTTRTFTGDAIHPDCVAAVEHTAQLLESLGHEVVPHEPEFDMHAFIVAWTEIVACGTQRTVDAALCLRSGLLERRLVLHGTRRPWPLLRVGAAIS
jgi:amidase